VNLLSRPVNPVLARELKERMRRRRSFAVLTMYLLVLATVLWLLYLGASAGDDFGGPGALRLASLGRATFQTLLFAMLLLVCFIVPGLSAGGVAGERERQTLVPLQVTLLRPHSILLGKLGASLAFVALLVMATLPLIGVSFVLGGVAPGEVIRGVAMVLVVATTVACLALTCSTLMRRVQGATVVSYAIVLFLVVGTFFAFGAEMLASREGPAGRSQAVLWLNPLMATADVVNRPVGGQTVPSPFTPLQELIKQRRGRPTSDSASSFGSGQGVIDANGSTITVMEPAPPPFRPPLLNRVPFWIFSLALYAVLSVGGLWLACRGLRTPAVGGGT
jgi:ABC-2 type transport system permease protein